MLTLPIYLASQPLSDNINPLATALGALLKAWQTNQTIRAIAEQPWIALQSDHGFIECTSCGSSGIPKIIRRQRRSWTDTMMVNQQLFALSSADRTAVLGAINHSLVLYGICESLFLAMPVNVLTGLRPAVQWRHLIASQITVLYITPTQLRLLCASGAVNPQVRLILCGGGKLDGITRQRAIESFPNAKIHEFYGASETSFITLADVTTPEGAVGKAYPGVEIIIRHSVAGVGEVWLRSPYLFEGYIQGENQETRHDGEFITVGELGWLDESQNLWLAGRQSRMVTIADQNIFPEAIESLLLQQLDQKLVAVIPKADPLRGHILHAFIQGRADPQLEKKLREKVVAQLGRASVPRKFHFLTDLPLLAAGKVDIRRLAEDYL